MCYVLFVIKISQLQEIVNNEWLKELQRLSHDSVHDNELDWNLNLEKCWRYSGGLALLKIRDGLYWIKYTDVYYVTLFFKKAIAFFGNLLIIQICIFSTDTWCFDILTSSMDESGAGCSGLGSRTRTVSVLEWTLYFNGGWDYYHDRGFLRLLRSSAA